MTDESFEIVDVLPSDIVGRGRCEDLMSRQEELELPAADDGIGEVVFATEFSDWRFLAEELEGDLGFKLGSELARLSLVNTSSASA